MTGQRLKIPKEEAVQRLSGLYSRAYDPDPSKDGIRPIANWVEGLISNKKDAAFFEKKVSDAKDADSLYRYELARDIFRVMNGLEPKGPSPRKEEAKQAPAPQEAVKEVPISEDEPRLVAVQNPETGEWERPDAEVLGITEAVSPTKEEAPRKVIFEDLPSSQKPLELPAEKLTPSIPARHNGWAIEWRDSKGREAATEMRDEVIVGNGFYCPGSPGYEKWVEAMDTEERYPFLPGSPSYQDRLSTPVAGYLAGEADKMFAKAKEIGKGSSISDLRQDEKFTSAISEMLNKNAATSGSEKNLREVFDGFNEQMRSAYGYYLTGQYRATPGFNTPGHESVATDDVRAMLTMIDDFRAIIYASGNHVMVAIGAEHGRYTVFNQMSGAEPGPRPVPIYKFSKRLPAEPGANIIRFTDMGGDLLSRHVRPEFSFHQSGPHIFFTRALNEDFRKAYGKQLDAIWEESKSLLRKDRHLENPETERRLLQLFNEQERLRLEFVEKHFKPPKFSIGVIQTVPGDCSIAAILAALCYSELEKRELAKQITFSEPIPAPQQKPANGTETQRPKRITFTEYTPPEQKGVAPISHAQQKDMPLSSLPREKLEQMKKEATETIETRAFMVEFCQRKLDEEKSMRRLDIAWRATAAATTIAGILGLVYVAVHGFATDLALRFAAGMTLIVVTIPVLTALTHRRLRGWKPDIRQREADLADAKKKYEETRRALEPILKL